MQLNINLTTFGVTYNPTLFQQQYKKNLNIAI